MALVPACLAALLDGEASPLFHALVCRHCSLSMLSHGFQDGQIHMTVCKMLGEMVFSRMEQAFSLKCWRTTLDSGESFSAKIGNTIKNYVSWSFYK